MNVSSEPAEGSGHAKSGDFNTVNEGGQAALTALFHEYNALSAENRIVIERTDFKIGIGVAAVSASTAAGLWQTPTFFLAVPFVFLFFATYVVVHMSQLVLLGAQLATIEEQVNALIGSEAMIYHSRTVPAIFDARIYRDPESGRRHISPAVLSGVVASIFVLLICVLTIWRGFPSLLHGRRWQVGTYLAVVAISFAMFGVWTIRVMSAKRQLRNLIRSLRREWPLAHASHPAIGDQHQQSNPGK